MASSKIIVSNRGALISKYGDNGLKAVEAAVDDLIAADAGRDLTTKLVYLDDKSALGSDAVTDKSSPAQNKAAIDAAFGKPGPDYLMILGALDVVPYQDLENPASDEDKLAPGDLPYACEAGYSRNVRDFLSPTRVTGRLPDLGGESDPRYLIKLLHTATNYAPGNAGDFKNYLGASATVWKKSTQLSLDAAFGNSAALNLCPPEGPAWGTRLGPKSHFVNCHGSPADPNFYGQKGQSYPVAFNSAQLQGINTGTVAAFECCYGSELYDPSLAAGEMSIAQAYLEHGGYAVWASSTIAYGPDASNEWADNMCQYFITPVLAGASVGRSALEARQKFINYKAVLDPYDLKTLAQYNLLGDPSVHPVRVTGEHGIVKVLMGSKMATGATATAALRRARRDHLVKLGTALGAIAITADEKQPYAAPKAVQEAMKREADKERATIFATATHPVRGQRQGSPTPATGPAKKAHSAVSSAGELTFHIAVARRSGVKPAVPQLVVLVATEEDGQVVIRKGFSR